MSKRADKYGLAAVILIGGWVLYYWLRPAGVLSPDSVLLQLDGAPPPALVDLTSRNELQSTAERTASAPIASDEEKVEKAAEAVAVQQPMPTEYLAKSGDTLTGISHRLYGRSADWVHIFNANRNLLNQPEDLRPGMRLIIPPRIEPTSNDAGARP